MKIIFKNKNNQIRSGWKIAIVIIMYLLVNGLITLAAGTVLGIIASVSRGGNISRQELGSYVSQTVSNNPILGMVFQLLDFISLMLVIYLALRIFDRKRFKDIGFAPTAAGFKDLVYGLALGAISMILIFVTLLATGSITLESGPNQIQFTSSAVWGLILFIFVGIKEELLTRGYCISMLNQMGRPWLSIAISSVLFSVLHFFNPNVRLLGLVNIVFVGVLFGYMYVKRCNLWMPIGYHITWNYFQGSVFGLAVSGGARKGIFNISAVKDNLLTGGSFGPEAGILTTFVIALGLIFVWKLPAGNSPVTDGKPGM